MNGSGEFCRELLETFLVAAPLSRSLFGKERDWHVSRLHACWFSQLPDATNRARRIQRCPTTFNGTRQTIRRLANNARAVTTFRSPNEETI